MEALFQAIVIGIIQGLTEFLPISSSAHLIVVPRVLGWNDPFLNSAEFDVMLHAGTLVALLVYFWRDLVKLVVAFVRSIAERRIGHEPDRRLAWLLAVSVVPAALVGFLLEDFFDTAFRDRLAPIAVFVVLGAALLWLAERRGKGVREMADLRPIDAVGVGIAQVFALFPGFSRSGVTIAAGLFLGLRRDEAARFSFLMGTPIIAGAALWKARSLLGADATPFDPVVLLGGMVAAAIAGLLAIGLLLAYLRRNSTSIFIWYRVLFAAGVIAFVLRT